MDVVGSALARHGDVAGVVETALRFLCSESTAEAHVPVLMPHVGAAVSAMARHSDAASVVEAGLCFLRNLVDVDAMQPALLTHADVVVSVMSRLVDHGGVAMQGVYVLYTLSLQDAHKPVLRAAGVEAAVRAAVARHGDADDGNVKRFGDLLLAAL